MKTMLSVASFFIQERQHPKMEVAELLELDGNVNFKYQNQLSGRFKRGLMDPCA